MPDFEIGHDMLIDSDKVRDDSFDKMKVALLNKGFAKIDGVTLDFRHPSITLPQWGFGALFNLCQFVPGEVSEDLLLNPIGIWFPWFNNYDEEKLRTDLTASKIASKFEPGNLANPNKVRKLTKAQVEEISNAARPKFYIYHGDSICVHKVEDEAFGPSYGVAYDAIAKLVYLQIRRKDGSSESIPTPVRVVSSHRIFDIDEEGDHFLSKLIWRIVATFNVSTVESLRTNSTKNGKIEILLTKLCDFFAENERELNPKSNDPEDKEAAEELLETLSTVAMIGYFWAQFEVRQNLTPLAEQGLKSLETLTTARTNSAANKKAEADKRWRDRAREEVISIYNGDKSLSQESIVRLLHDRLAGVVILPLGRPVPELVANMRKTNQLGPRVEKNSSSKRR